MTVLPVVATSAPAAAATRAFTCSTRDSGNTWTAAGLLQQRYTAQVLADHPYFFYRTDEPGGTVAADSSGRSRSGTYSAVGAYHQPGALPGNPGYAVALNGGGRIIGGGTAVNDPVTSTLELWFKTSSTSGGKLIGFDSTTGTSSAAYDRHVFLRGDGRLVYGGWPGGSPATTSGTYNDNAWHHLVVVGTAGLLWQNFSVFVDGVDVVNGSTFVSAYSGYWQVGSGPLPLGTGYPSGSFTGSIDDVAVYQTALSASRIAAHYASR